MIISPSPSAAEQRVMLKFVFLRALLLRLAVEILLGTFAFFFLSPTEVFPKYWIRWDANWYLDIAKSGYWFFGKGVESNVGFFPLYPLFIRVLSSSFGLSLPVAGLAISAVSFVLSLSLLSILLIGDGGKRREVIAKNTLTCYLLFPFSIFLWSSFTDSLFLLLVVAIFFFLSRERLSLVIILAFFASLTRPHGVLLVFPIFLRFVRELRKGVRSPIVLFKCGVAVVSPLVGFFSYMIWLAYRFGSITTFFDAKLAWGSSLTIQPFRILHLYLRRLYLGYLTADADFYQALLETFVFLLFAGLLLRSFKRFSQEYFIFSLSMLGLSLFTTPSYPLSGYGRYVLPIFPLFVTLGEYISTHRFGSLVKIAFSISYVFILFLWARGVFLG